jgi:hypothetical protein
MKRPAETNVPSSSTTKAPSSCAGLAEVGQLGAQDVGRMAVQRVEQKRPRAREHVLHVSDDEQCPDLAALASFAG